MGKNKYWVLFGVPHHAKYGIYDNFEQAQALAQGCKSIQKNTNWRAFKTKDGAEHFWNAFLNAKIIDVKNIGKIIY